MNRQTFRSSLFIATMLAASAAFAGGDIVKCVDQSGKVTLTENQCSEGVQTVLVAGDAPALAEDATTAEPTLPAAPAARRAVQRVAYTPAAIQHDNWTAPKSNSRPLARDVETLKAARISMKVLDEASSTSRQQRLAGLN
jgi:predicted HD phosphohydrolase